MCSYAPTNCADDKIAEDFYQQLTEEIKLIPKHNVLIVAGDFNAQTGPTCNIPGASYHQKPNRNGQLLLDLLTECNMKSLNTSFRKRKGQLWTINANNCHFWTYK